MAFASEYEYFTANPPTCRDGFSKEIVSTQLNFDPFNSSSYDLDGCKGLTGTFTGYQLKNVPKYKKP